MYSSTQTRPYTAPCSFNFKENIVNLLQRALWWGFQAGTKGEQGLKNDQDLKISTDKGSLMNQPAHHFQPYPLRDSKSCESWRDKSSWEAKGA